jgi:glycosyltransferase involved in cell wall biosynthesis
MKTLFLSASDVVGGAARATYWLARGLRELGEDVSMGVQRQSGDFSWTWTVQRGKLGSIVDSFRTSIDALPLRTYSERQRVQWSLNLLPNPKLTAAILQRQPDIVNLHWVGGGFLPIAALQKISSPVVWSLYDMWPFSGGCHYDDSCGRHIEACGSCPQLRSAGSDISNYVWRRKKHFWQGLPITVVAPSRWLAQEARRSSLFKDSRVVVIPHGTALDVFKPISKGLARELVGLPKDRRIVLFGAMGGTQDKRKGYQYLEPALKHLSAQGNHSDISLAIFGASAPTEIPDLGFPVHYLGRLHDDVSLAVLYAAADVTVTPSMQEAFGMTASESLACGTPVVAFGATGPLDVIDHKINGYLARPFEAKDLAEGIAWVLDNASIRSLGAAGRQKCEQQFDLQNVSRQYRALYQELLTEAPQRQSKL